MVFVDSRNLPFFIIFLRHLQFLAEQSGATVHSADGEELHYTSPKANKRLSFKNATRKTSAFGNSDC